ncbi:glycosyl hydrolase family 28-related protein [Ramlibacter tataouinensis]|uniref:right-handed parallel beta-helix repeat-containing protein n=1 Tax=Ramlibacter tataouinensis TaxID=94132 RepID=UPI0022F39176|nr:right-handed parallel beta-helix repeat-containing protein [Ramlibacter tataouinensis]WBY00790.1 glycosyl hydrolase family 28-related protein [Ramlibacter tataouinensis]
MSAVLAACGGGGGGDVASSATGADVATSGLSPSSPAPAPAPAGISLTNYGGVCDGRTDNNAAISRGIADTKAKGLALLIPAGQCNFSSVIQLDGGKIAGAGPTSVLYATNWQQASIYMRGNAPSVTKVKLTGAPAPGRVPNWESTKIMIWGATNFVIDGVTIENSPAASIQTLRKANRGLITNNTIRNSLSDSIHLTDGASDITVENNVIDGSGDDGIAVVSYQGDGTPVSNVTARNNIVRGNKWGRNMSVLGGRNILYENNLLQNNSQWACLYFAQETPWNTFNVIGATAQRNTLQNCGNVSNGHGAVLIFSDGSYNGGAPNDDIKVISNDIIQDGRNGFNWWGPQTNVRLENNRYTGSGPAYAGNGPGVTVVPHGGGTVGYVAP